MAPAMRKIWRETLDKVTPYEAGPSLEQVEQELGLSSVIRLSANENPLGPSPKVAESLRREAERVHLYPDGASQSVRAALAEWIGVDPGWLVVGNGADELIGFLGRAAFGLRKGKMLTADTQCAALLRHILLLLTIG